MTPTDFAERVHKAAGRYSVYSRADVGIYEVRYSIIHVETFSNFTAAQSEADRLNREAARAIVGPLVEALKDARAALHQHYIDWDGEPEDAVPLQLARAKCDAALTTLDTTDEG